jgi:hypothetical protein
MANFAKNVFYTGRYDLPELLVQQLVEFPTAITHKPLTIWSCLTDHQKVERVVFRNGIRTSGVSANLRLEIEDLLCRCSVQVQNSAATSIVEILQLLNRLADRVIWVMVRNIGDLPKLLVFNSRTKSFANSSIFAFCLLLLLLYGFLYLLSERSIWG